MAKKRKSRVRRPDEAFSAGPFHVARFGEQVYWKSEWPEDAFAEMQKSWVDKYPKVVQAIDTLVKEIADIVTAVAPATLLHRAWGEIAVRHSKIKSEIEIEADDATSMRMLDYVQSIVIAVPPRANQRQDISAEDWKTLREKVGKLFHAVSVEYQICRTAKSQLEDPNFNSAFEDFFFRAQLYWCNVRGNRYQVHQPSYLRDMFIPYGELLQELFGITGEQFVNEFIKIWHALSFGIQDVLNALLTFQKDSMEAIERKIAMGPPFSAMELPALMDEVVRENHWEDRRKYIEGSFFGMDLFDIQKVTTLPQQLLNELTWSPGEEKEFFADGEYRGWPLRIWPVTKRPFIQLNEHCYCLDLYSLMDNLYRVVQRIVLRLRPEHRERWNRIQQQLTEELPLRYLGQILPSSKIVKQAYYQGRTDAGAIERCEADGLLIYDDWLFVIEARGGAFTYTPPATDFPAYVASIKNLVLKPVTQGRRFVEYLRSAEKVPIFDQSHSEVAVLSRTHFRHVVICAVTLDPFTEIAAQVQHLHKIGVDVGAEPVWVISIDDLRAYADIFENPLLFLHYVEQRIQAFRSTAIQSDDEFDHLGLYLKHNHYSTYTDELARESGAEIKFTGYRVGIDEFFADRMLDSNAPCPLKQDIPARILEIVGFLSRTDSPHRSEVASYLLDFDGEWRKKFSQSVDEELGRQPHARRAKPFSMHGNVYLTAFCWTDSWSPRDAAVALDHARAVLLVNNDACRLLLELSYTDEGALRSVDWQWIDLSSIPPGMLPKLRTEADQLRQARVAKAKSERKKIGRNERCPCGSGRKYKRCCLAR